jgi:hypothetical protein
MAYRRPKKGDVRVFNGVKVRFGVSGGFKHDEDVKRFANSPGAGLYARGIDPESPTVEQDTLAWLKRYRENPNNRKGQAGYNRAFSEAQYGRDDARQPGLKTLMAQNPNAPVHALFDMTARNYQAQNALAPRDFNIMTILDPIIATGLGFINPALSAAYMGGRTAGEGGDFLDIALSAGGGYLGGMSGASLKAGVSAAGGWANYARNIGSSIANAPSNALNYLKYGPELSSAEFASYFPGGAAESTLSNINTASLFPRAFENAVVAGRLPGGTAAGMSNAARAAGAIGTANTLSKGADTLGAQAGAKGGDVSWVSEAVSLGKGALNTLKSDFGITGGDLLRGGANLISGAMSANAAEEAARMQANAATAGGQLASQTADKQMALLEKMFNRQVELQEPFRQSGVAAQNRMLDLLGLSPNRGAAGYGSLAKNFGMADFQADPGYAFRMTEGLKALDRQAAARGGLISGGALKAAQNYGQDLASQEYQNAYNRYQTNRTNLLNPLQSLAGAGQTSANTIGNAAAGYGSEGSNALGGAGTAQANAIQNAANARASGYLGSQQSWNSALQNVAAIPGQSQQTEFMNALMKKYLS